MSVNAGATKVAVGAKVPTKGSRPPTGVFAKTKWTLAVSAVVALLALVAFAALVAGSQAPGAEHHSSAAGTNSRLAAEAVVPVSEPAAPKMGEQEALDAYEKLPLSFIPNEGQTDKAVRYYAQGAGYGFFFTKEGATLSFAEGKGRGHALGLDFLGANPAPTLTAQERLPGKVNYLAGDDPSKWQQGLPTHAQLLYEGLWPGIDMAVRGEGGKLKYEFHLKAGSSVDDVRLAYRGAHGLKVGSGGDLLVRTRLGVLKDAAPVSYQRIGGERVPVESRYVLKGDGGYGFAVGAHDPRYPLVIDPGLAYSTFLGGASSENGQDIAVDGEGNAYVTGGTFSADYPTTPGAFDRTFDACEFCGDAFVTKLNASGSALVYSTFLGGTNSDGGLDIAVDGEGNAYVTGTTNSVDYPTTDGAFDTTLDTTFNGITDAFVTKLNASGSALVYSTFLGGAADENPLGIALDGEGSAYVTGDTESTEPVPFPTTDGAFDRTSDGADAFVTKLNASGSDLDYSTILGGGEIEHGRDIAVDGEGSAYVTGVTVLAPPNFPKFPTTQGAFDGTSDDFGETFVTKFNASGSDLDYSTFLGGGSRDEGFGIAVDAEGSAYVTGFTENRDRDAFVTKLNASGSALDYSAFLAGEGFDRGRAIAVDGEGSAYVTGDTTSADFPTTRGALDTTFNGGNDAFATKLNASGSALDNSTYLGGAGGEVGFGIAVDGEGSAYVAGRTGSDDLPTTDGAFDRTYSGGDAFVTKLLYGDFT